jgi:hypothetical protein
MYCAHLYTCQRISEKSDAGSVTQCMIPLYHLTSCPPFIPPKEYVKRRTLAQWRSEWSSYHFFFCVVIPFITNLCMPQMSRVLRLLELSHSSNHVNDGRPIAAHPSSGPLPPLGPLSSPLSPSLPARCPPPFLFYPNIYLLAIISFCFFKKIIKT